MLSFEQKDLLQNVVVALKPFEDLTDLLSGEKVVTVSSIAPMLSHIAELAQEVHDADSISGDKVTDIRDNIWEYIKTRCVVG